MSNSIYVGKFKSFACALILIVPLSACAQEKDVVVPDRENLMPFSINFDLEGKPILLDEKGSRIPPSDIKFPIKATEIESVDGITLVQYKGSHVKLVKIGGDVYAIPIPHK